MTNRRPPTLHVKHFKNWLFELDRVLRGEATCRRELFRDCPKNAEIRFPLGGVSVVLGALGGGYGCCMGMFALLRGGEAGQYTQACLQMFASIAKVPLLFALTIVVTFPSLYVFNALVGSGLKIASVFRLLVASLAVNLSVLASLGPVVAFFTFSSSNYSFIVLLHVVIFTVAGLLGLLFLVQTLRNSNPQSNMQETSNRSPIDDHLVAEVSPQSLAKLESPSSSGTSSTPSTNRRNVDWVFSCWMVAFGLVGAQMGWILRPFVGSPNLEFELFRTRQSNFFQAVWNALFNLYL